MFEFLWEKSFVISVRHRENKTVVIDFRETTPENAMNER